MPKYYVFQTEVHTMTGTHVYREEGKGADKVRIDTGVEEDYKVSKCADGHWECSCKSWIFQRKHLNDGVRLSDFEIERLIDDSKMSLRRRGIPESRWPSLEWHPNGMCKHASFVEANRDDITRAIQNHATVRIQSSEFYADIVGADIDGRLAGFVDSI